MMPSSSICTVANAQHPRRLSAGSAQARSGALDSLAVAPPILSRDAQIARSHRRIPPCFAASRSRQPLQSRLRTPSFVAKSP